MSTNDIIRNIEHLIEQFKSKRQRAKDDIINLKAEMTYCDSLIAEYERELKNLGGFVSVDLGDE